jgi:peptidoglycan/LPS O-acetylase OafA/YrhL
VLLYHATLRPSGALADRFFSFWTYSGWFGVDLFFVLSGFLITGILHDSKGSGKYFSTFYFRRFLRIFPAYYATLFVLLIVLPNIPYIQQHYEKLVGGEIWYWLYLSNISLGLERPETPRRLDYFWSLAIEEQFYLVWPLIVLLFGRHRLMAICGGVIAFAIVWRSALVVAGAHPQAVFALTPSRLDALAVGAFIALAARGDVAFQVLLRWAPAVIAGTGIVLLGMAISDGGFNPYAVGMQCVGFTLLAVFFGGVVVLSVASTRSILVHVLEHSVLRAFGRYSYATYLFHYPMINFFLETRLFSAEQLPTLGGSSLPAQLLFYLITIPTSFLMAWLSWHLFEKHFLALKRYFSYQQKSAPKTPSAAESKMRREAASEAL